MLRIRALAATLTGAVLSASLAMALGANPALAGGCRHASAECYQKVKTPDVYATVARPVVLAPARHEVVVSPPVVVDRLEKVEIQPARFAVHHTPAVKALVHRPVEVAPARAHVSWSPAVYATRHRHVVVSPGAVRWERKRDRHGRETLCKVHTPAVTRTVAEKVMIAPPRRAVHVTPAVYANETRTVVVRQVSRHTVYQPALYAWHNRPVIARPAYRHIVTHPPVIGVRHEHVLVQRGGTQWQPVGYRRW